MFEAPTEDGPSGSPKKQKTEQSGSEEKKPNDIEALKAKFLKKKQKKE